MQSEFAPVTRPNGIADPAISPQTSMIDFFPPSKVMLENGAEPVCASLFHFTTNIGSYFDSIHASA